MRTGHACIVCDLPADPEPYAVHYEPGDTPPFPSSRIWLCDLHGLALSVGPRPVRHVPRVEGMAL